MILFKPFLYLLLFKLFKIKSLVIKSFFLTLFYIRKCIYPNMQQTSSECMFSSDIIGAYWISSNSSFIKYCYRNIGLFSIAPHLVIT